MTKRLCIILTALGLVGMHRRALAQTPLGTDFTYQGQLKASGLPAVANADFQFSLYDALAGGAQVGSTVPKDNVALVNGAFTLSLDFGAAAFNGDARWIEVAVRSPAGSGGFTTLTPRQPITVTPHANYSMNMRGIAVDSTGRVGIGTTNPGGAIATSKLDVVGGHVTLSNSRGCFSLNAAGNGMGAGFDSTATNELQLIANGLESARIAADGNMGIGTTAPQAGLHIRCEPASVGGTLALEGSTQSYLSFFPDGAGAGRKGYFGFTLANSPDLTIATEAPNGRIVMNDASGVHFPTGGKENLRIIRGFVIGSGIVDYGSGFTVTRIEEGRYLINFDTPFAELPVATANTVSVGFSSCFIEFSGIGPASIGLHVVRRSDGDLVDGHFYFIAMGPR